MEMFSAMDDRGKATHARFTSDRHALNHIDSDTPVLPHGKKTVLENAHLK